jgi:hypothetical protein
MAVRHLAAAHHLPSRLTNASRRAFTKCEKVLANVAANACHRSSAFSVSAYERERERERERESKGQL